LPDHTQSSALQFVGQDRFVGRFQQTRPKARMNPEGRIHDQRRHFVLGHAASKRISRKAAKIAKKTSPAAES
jgi:hypothetical protein